MSRKDDERNLLAIKGLVGWYVQGIGYCDEHSTTTFSSGPRDNPPGDCIAIDMSEVYSKDGIAESAGNIWKRPTLDCGLPPGNVRCLFEGCIGNEGTTKGHPWDGRLESLQSLDSVGVDVYVACLIAAGGKVIDNRPEIA